MNVPFKMHKGYDPLGLCGKGKCPVCARNNALFKVRESLPKAEFQSDAVAPFVGRFGYPNINIGILAPPQNEDDSWLYDSPKYWAYKDFEIPRIVDFRTSLLNSRYTINVKSRPKLLEISQELGMSSEPVDIDVVLKKKPSFQMNLDSHMAPTGPQAQLRKIKPMTNAKIHTKVQKVYDDIDWKAQDAMTYLYENKFDENFLTRILSVGTLGMKKNRKLVPTRWSLTATHDTLGKHLIGKLKDNPTINYSAFFGGYLGNYYLMLCFPDVWSYELFEMYAGNPHKYMTDFEDYYGRKNYAQQTAGGYYTVRMAAAEKLRALRRQSSILALRFITDEYTMPLGVWVTLESARKSFSSKPIEFSSKELLLEFAKKFVRKKFNMDISSILRKSLLLNSIKQQSKLDKFF